MPRLPLPALLLATSLLSAPVFAQAPLTLDQVMADPDWIGPPVEQAWWSWDGTQVQYLLKREGATIRDTYRQPVDGGAAQKVDGAARADGDVAPADLQFDFAQAVAAHRGTRHAQRVVARRLLQDAIGRPLQIVCVEEPEAAGLAREAAVS